uniref:DUF7788 domain-containing protein n=1 Tax=Rhizochromulina marina TaxID=1034831 RepID=A0A7S2SFL9_9STRA
MGGTPMDVAVALGILVSELASDEFRNEVLTFESTPQWHRIPSDCSLKHKVRNLKRAPWGGSTNFAAALEAILQRCIKNRLSPDQVPDLIVFSDMQFDSADGGSGGFTDAVDRIRRNFYVAGMQAIGQPYPMPTITFWNLRGTTQGFVTQADRPGVRMLSGYSPALFKLVVEGGEDEALAATTAEGGEGGDEAAAEGGAAVRRPMVTPYQTLRKAIDDTAYDLVRAVVLEAGQGPFAGATASLDEATRSLLAYVRQEPEARQLKRKREEAAEEEKGEEAGGDGDDCEGSGAAAAAAEEVAAAEAE